jgi:hypothetical protein
MKSKFVKLNSGPLASGASLNYAAQCRVKSGWRRLARLLGPASLLSIALAPEMSRGCACGCGIFDVGTSAMFPGGAGVMAFVDYAYQDQNRNWSGYSKAPEADNADKSIRTDFLDLGALYMFNRSWGVQAQVPWDYRYFTTQGGKTGNDIVSLNWGSPGDVRLKGIYTGFSEDLSIGLTFGVKLPTGNFTHNDQYNDIDRDTEIGSGSTDMLLGGFFRHRLTSDFSWSWFAQGELDVPVLTQNQYRPGIELNAAIGVHYSGWSIHGVKIRPVGQAIFSERTSDTGAEAAGGAFDDPAGGVSSGYQRVLLSPGIEFEYHHVRLYTDVKLPVFQHFTGDQLAAPASFQTVLSVMF